MRTVFSLGSLFSLSAFFSLAFGGLPHAQLLAQTTSGSQIVLNGKTYPGYWFASESNGRQTLAVSDGDLDDDFGMLLLDSNNAQVQPVQWFSNVGVPLSAQFPSTGALRYLDITQLKTQLGWQVQPQGNALIVNSGAAQVQSLKSGLQTWGRRVVVELDRPTPWRFTNLTNSRSGKTDREFTVTVDAALSSTATPAFNAAAGGGLKSISVAKQGTQTLISGKFSGGMRAEAWTLANPPRLVVDIRPDPMRSRNIAWSSGIRWRESVLTLGTQRFPISWLEIAPKTSGLRMLPIWGNDPTQLVGIHPLAYTSNRMRAAASINAGFFDRKFQNPLGAIRRDGRWISSPILNRGVIGWNDSGQFQVGRLNLQELAKTSQGQTVTIVAHNSGYPRRGISRYSPQWGAKYRPIKQDGTEQIYTVINDRVQAQTLSKGIASVPIPKNGYVLVARAFDASQMLSPGTGLTSSAMTSSPSQFEQFPHIMGAGPLLVSNNQVVLNIASETFQKSFEAAAAPRSAIAQRSDGTILLATSHNRIGGAGPTLREWALLLQKMGGATCAEFRWGAAQHPCSWAVD